MRRFSLVSFFAILFFLSNTAFLPVSQTAAAPSGSWSDVVMILVLMIVVAVFIVLQANLTPETVARYGLDQPSHDHPEH